MAVVEHHGQFLIGQRPEGAALASLWEFPGGKVEAGETIEAAAVRECAEETGLKVEAVGRYPSKTQWYEHGGVELYFIACRLAGAGESPRPPFRWTPRGALADYEFPAGNRELLALLARGQ